MLKCFALIALGILSGCWAVHERSSASGSGSALRDAGTDVGLTIDASMCAPTVGDFDEAVYRDCTSAPCPTGYECVDIHAIAPEDPVDRRCYLPCETACPCPGILDCVTTGLASPAMACFVLVAQ